MHITNKHILAAQSIVEANTNISGLQKVNDSYEVKQWIQENEVWDCQYVFSPYKECTRFISFSVQMLTAFPVGMLMRKLVRKNKRLNYILQFEELQSIRNNIEKGSFAYDTLLFKQSPLQLLQNKSHLANLVCLALLFGDEFIDGIANSYGKENIQKLLNDKAFSYYLQGKQVGTKIELYYAFDICAVLPPNVLETVNTKYGITYKAFYGHLQFLLAEMNVHLNKLTSATAQEAATLICSVCNKCFDTYKVDVQAFSSHYDWNTLLAYQQSKDDEIVKVLLALRATLLHKNKLKYSQKFSSWATMVRSMQVYDDMQDVAADCTYQMNFLVFFAKAFFPAEWYWLLQHKADLLTQKTFITQQQIAIHMPNAMMLCMQYNKNITIKQLNWVQQKIQNYLWRKNWLHFNTETVVNDKRSIDMKVISSQILQAKNDLVNETMQYAHILDIILLHPTERKKLFTIMSKSEYYFLKNGYTTYPTYKKALLAKRFLTLLY
jgi:predicted DNA binding CopG/RHH family protein